MQEEKRGIFKIPRTVFILGIVSFLTDISSEMLVPIVPQFLRDVLKAPVQFIGVIEGIAESTASFLRVFAGWLADKTGRPKLLTTLGYGISAFAKPFFAITTAWPQILVIRFLDRFGKGIRSAPRDAIIADVTHPSERGRAFGFHRAMDTTGAVLGPLVVFFLLFGYYIAGELAIPRSMYQLIFIIAAVPAIISVLVLGFFVKERPKSSEDKPLPKVTLRVFDHRFKMFLLGAAVFSIGNSSDAFLILRARDFRMGVAEVLLVYVFFNAISALLSAPGGIVSDKIGRKPVIVGGLVVFAAVYVGFALANNKLAIWLLFMLYGIYYALTEGVLRAYAADLAPRELRGTALGTYYTLIGIAVLPASVIAGQLWDRVNHAAPFWYGAAAALLGAVILLLAVPKQGRLEE